MKRNHWNEWLIFSHHKGVIKSKWYTHVHIKDVHEVSDNHLLMYGNWTITHMLGAHHSTSLRNGVLLKKARPVTCNDPWQLQSFHHLIYPFCWMQKTQRDEHTPERGRAGWEQTARTSNSFEAAVSSHEQSFMEMSLCSFAAVPAYWCLYRGTVDRLLVAGQTDVNLSSEGEPQ